MEEIQEDKEIDDSYFLPQDAVLRPTSQMTKLRVVFNASAKTTKRVYLNVQISKVGVHKRLFFNFNSFYKTVTHLQQIQGNCLE